ncbi:hypothetical protein Taro_026882 [Colocasia esculenta]|uniref:WRKY domain-containing protein n=1 Tax=Colocasia esculenta TaxID=4460 RepID=A0A843VKW2_COLES|nr:hypothetical protein [Colocasia esculenta]
MAAVMEPSQAAMPFTSLVMEEPLLHLPSYDFAGGSFEQASAAFELSEFMAAFDDGGLPEGSGTSFNIAGSQDRNIPALPAGGNGDPGMITSDGMMGGKRLIRMDPGDRIAFRTKTEIDVLDDGYKWRKYGKKSVKSNPNPRNYYRCSAEGCSVKKRVERDREDRSFVVTTYDGMHNHLPPGSGVVYHPVPRDGAAGHWGFASSSSGWMDGPMIMATSQPSERTTTPQVAHSSC